MWQKSSCVLVYFVALKPFFHFRQVQLVQDFPLKPVPLGKLATGLRSTNKCSCPNVSWGKAGHVAHFPSPPRGFEQKLSTRIVLLRRLAESGWGADAKTLRISALIFAYSPHRQHSQ